MENKNLTQTILKGLEDNAGNLKESGIDIDGRFIKELSQILYETAQIKGLDPELALALRQAALGPVAGRLGL